MQIRSNFEWLHSSSSLSAWATCISSKIFSSVGESTVTKSLSIFINTYQARTMSIGWLACSLVYLQGYYWEDLKYYYWSQRRGCYELAVTLSRVLETKPRTQGEHYATLSENYLTNLIFLDSSPQSSSSRNKSTYQLIMSRWIIYFYSYTNWSCQDILQFLLKYCKYSSRVSITARSRFPSLPLIVIGWHVGNFGFLPSLPEFSDSLNPNSRKGCMAERIISLNM